MNILRSIKLKRLAVRKGYVLPDAELKTVNNQEVHAERIRLSIDLQDRMEWWTRSHGHFDDKLYVQVLKAKMQSA